MAKLGKNTYAIISAAVIIIGVIVMLAAGFGYSTSGSGVSAVVVSFDYGTETDSLDFAALGEDLEELVGAAPLSIEHAVDSYTTFPAIAVNFPLGTELDGESILAMLQERYSSYSAASAAVYAAEPTFTRSTITHFFGMSFIAIAVMCVIVALVRNIKTAVRTLIMLVHNILLLLSLCAIFRLPGETYLLACSILTVFVTVYVSVRSGEGDCSAYRSPASIAIVAASFALFALAGLLFGATGLFALGVAMALAIAIPVYSETAFAKNS